MKRVCVFCGSSSGLKAEYEEYARQLGFDLAHNQLGLVYGGASIGVMGALADAALSKGGKVWGVIPTQITELEVAHDNLTELYVVESMHERKAKMYALSDVFMALPGGMGTLDELCEIITWSQLMYHHKPVYLVNYDGFFDGLMQHFRHINREGFLSDEHLALVREVGHHSQALSEILG